MAAKNQLMVSNGDLKTLFKIIHGKYLLIIDSDELQSSNNQYIKSDGFIFVLLSMIYSNIEFSFKRLRKILKITN